MEGVEQDLETQVSEAIVTDLNQQPSAWVLAVVTLTEDGTSENHLYVPDGQPDFVTAGVLRVATMQEDTEIRLLIGDLHDEDDDE